jgi:hypothetical protein
MALEVMSRKKLHVHAVPVALFVGGLMALSTAVLSGVASNTSYRENVAIQALTGGVLDVQAEANGLASVKAHELRPTLPQYTSAVGNSAGLQFSFE